MSEVRVEAIPLTTVRGSLARQVADHLRSLILSGALAPGTHLHQRQLAADLSVSRTPLREALQALLTDRLVVQNLNGSYTVAQPTAKDICDLYELRAVVEAFAARSAAERASEADLRHLEELVWRLEAGASQARPSETFEFYTALTEFRVAVLHASGNSGLLTFETTIRLSAQESYRLLRLRRQPFSPRIVEVQRRIYEAIRRRDGDEAAQLASDYALGTLRMWREEEQRQAQHDPGR